MSEKLFSNECWGNPLKRKAFVLQITQYGETPQEAEENLEELRSLTLGADIEIISSSIYKLRKVNTNTGLGSGKLEELIEELITHPEVDLIVLGMDLRAYQIKNIEDYFNIEVADRTRIILEIFKSRATSKEGKLQVELAEAEYEIGRQMRGEGKEMSKLGVGMRGPGEQIGEKRLRVYRKRIAKLKSDLKAVKKQRCVTRRNAKYPNISLVGYTNAGKSTLLNSITGKENTLAKNQLFTTLDPTTRSLYVGTNADFTPQYVTLTDTVGFIKNLPHELVDGFESTLSLILESSLCIVLIDASDPRHEEKRLVIEDTLDSIGSTAPRLVVYNKSDRVTDDKKFKDKLLISAYKKEGFDELRERIREMVYK
jgi:GTPase